MKYRHLVLAVLFLSLVSNVWAQQLRTEDDKDENETIETSILHGQQRWYKLMEKPRVKYSKVQSAYEKYFAEHADEGSGPKEYGVGWLKTKIFYLDRKGRVQDAPKADMNRIKPRAMSGAPTDTYSGDWRMIGPVNTYNGPGAGGGNNGGYAYCVRMDPTNTNKLFCGFVTGGLWMSSDNGVSWSLTDANLPADSYYDIDVCAANSDVVYAISRSAVIKSTDGGASWLPTALNSTNYSGTAYDIAASPSDPNVVIARWGTKIYRTADGGSVWTEVQTGLQNFSIWDSNLNSEVIDFDNNNSSVVYATDRGNSQNSVAVYRSTNAGQNFSLFQTITLPGNATGTVTGWSKVCTATNNTNAVYIMIGSGSSSYSHVAVHLFKLNATNGNIDLQRINMVDGINTDYGSTTSLHHGDIAMDITNENKIVWGSYSQQNVQYSTNNGVSFSTSTSSVHSDLRSIYMYNGKVILGTDGSGDVSTDGGDHFSIVTKSVSNHELWGFGSAFKSSHLAAGTNHGPLMVRDSESANGWFTLLGADQGNSDFNPLDSVSAYSQGYDSYHITLTGNQNWVNGSQQIDPGGIYSYFNSMEFHPHRYHTLITHHAGQYPSSVPQETRDIWKNSLIRSDDNGLTVSVVHTFNAQLFREKICVGDTSRIYAVVGLTNNSLMKTTDGGATWTDITPSTSVTGASIRNISDIAVSDVNPNEIWVSYSGVQSTCKVLHSTDGGSSYTNLTQSVLTSFPITKMIFQRGTDGGVYVGNESGIYYRNNTMSNWVELGNGLPAMDIRFLFINYYKGKLLIGTSRGAWDHDLYESSNTMAQISANTLTPTCQEPKVQFRDFSVVSNAGNGATYQWDFPGGTPSTSNLETPLVSYLGATPGTYDVTLTVTDENGTSTQTLQDFITYTAENCCEDLPSGWVHIDIGTTTTPSEVCYTPSDGNFKITSHSSGISDPNDNFPFIFKGLVGDGEIVARVKDVTDIWNYSGGIMLRNSLAANSNYLFLNSLDSRGVFDIYRTNNTGNTGYQLVTTYPMPMWLKIVRSGNQLTTHYSADGVNWTLYHSFNQTLNQTVYVGLAASKDGCVTNIDNVSVTGQVVTGVEDQEKEPALSAYPNPMKTSVTVSGLSGTNVLKMLDASGKLVYSINTSANTETIPTEGMATGLYIISVENAEQGTQQTINVMKE